MYNVERNGSESDTDSFKVVHHRRARDRMPEVRAAEARGLKECAARRARVLAFPDIAHELTLSPLWYTDPERWNGYIPPAAYNGRPNASTRRAALILICETVAQAEQEASDR